MSNLTQKLLRPRPILAVSALLAVGAGVASTTAHPTGCHSSSLRSAMTVIPGSAGAGQVHYSVALTNTGHSGCRLANQLLLRLLTAGGAQLPTYMLSDAKPGILRLHAGQTLTDEVRFSPDIPGRNEPTTGPCEPVAVRVRVRLGSPGNGVVIGPITPPTSVCNRGSIRERGLR